MSIEQMPLTHNNKEEMEENIEIDQEASYLNEIEKRVDEIIANFLNKEGYKEYKIIEVRKTHKSVFGCLEIEGRQYFFKISKPERILKELQGYKIASEYPHEEVFSHFFEDNYGIYLQGYCEEIYKPDGQMLNQINRALDSDDIAGEDILKRTNEIFTTMGVICESSLTKKPIVFNGQNDVFFHDRIRQGGRVDKLYKNKILRFPSLSENISFEDLASYSFILNGEKMEFTIDQLLNLAKQNLSTEKERIFVLSQGDPTETNMTLSGKFFDFETAGYNSIAQDIAIFSYYNFTGGHYFIPKYSNAETLVDIKQRNGKEHENLTKFVESIELNYSIDKTRKTFDINIKFPYPIIKEEILHQYINNIVKRVEKLIPDNLQRSLIEELQSALLLRIIGVKDLTKFEEKDLVLSLALINYLSQPDKDIKSMSEFLNKKFKSINF